MQDWDWIRWPTASPAALRWATAIPSAGANPTCWGSRWACATSSECAGRPAGDNPWNGALVWGNVQGPLPAPQKIIRRDARPAPLDITLVPLCEQKNCRCLPQLRASCRKLVSQCPGQICVAAWNARYLSTRKLDSQRERPLGTAAQYICVPHDLKSPLPEIPESAADRKRQSR